MLIQEIEITNFKGVQATKIEIVTRAPGNVVTLIGLNESGKTTILEAISNFVSVDTETSSLVQAVSVEQRPIDLIPKSKKSNFSGQIDVRAKLKLDNVDIKSLGTHLRKELGVRLVEEECPRELTVLRRFEFVDSDLKSTSTLWGFCPVYLKKTGTKKHEARSTGATSDVWHAATKYLPNLFPKIVYFPTFLFSVPEKIYLGEIDDWATDEDRVINQYFRQVFQDIADSLDEDISIERHIVDRVLRQQSAFPTPLDFLAKFWGMDEAAQIKAVVNKLSGKITRTVFDAWNEIFGQTVSEKRVTIDFGLDAEKANAPYVQLQIYDGEQSYSIHERSLGFRWFFTFLLFTQFRRSRHNERGTVFLFDEPASNLHARAQMKLLESFGKTAQNDQFIIYSTHSHYMIDPMWLEKAYIVQNKGIDFEREDAGTQFESKTASDIVATRYRHFVSKNPTRISYFQPALDALKYGTSPMMPGKMALVVEGKFDFHPLIYFKERLRIFDGIEIIPAPSASEVGPLISLMRGLGTKFVVLLDDDKAGRASARRYRDHHLLGPEQVTTLAELDAKLKNKSFESLYSKQVNLGASGQEDKATKGEYSLFFQRLSIEHDFEFGLGTTTNRVKSILSKLEKTIRDLP